MYSLACTNPCSMLLIIALNTTCSLAMTFWTFSQVGDAWEDGGLISQCVCLRNLYKKTNTQSARANEHHKCARRCIVHEQKHNRFSHIHVRTEMSKLINYWNKRRGHCHLYKLQDYTSCFCPAFHLLPLVHIPLLHPCLCHCVVEVVSIATTQELGVGALEL